MSIWYSGSFMIAVCLLCESSIARAGDFRSSPEDIAPVVAPFTLPPFSRPQIPDRTFNIKDYGAVEGGVEKNTEAIRKTIEAAARAGGGRVVIPPGKWLTGAIHLDNNIDLHIAKGAELLFSQDFADYLPVVFSRHEDTECFKHSSFIYAEGKTNIAITGEGVLNGQGKPWWGFKESKKDVEARLRDMGEKDVPVEKRIFDGSDGNILRPAFFQPMNCTNVLVEGVTFLYGAFWTITPTYCENVILRRVRIETEGAYGHTPNGDGVDPSSCRNVLIEYCEFNTGDDCVAIKSGRDRDGLRVGKPTENVVVRHCRGLRGHGGIVVGSETSGGIRNVYAFDCSFKGTDRIVRIKTARGRGGVVEHMWFRGLTGEEIVMEAIHLNMLYTGTRFPEQPVSASTPRVRDIHIADVTCTSGKSYAVEMLGLPEMPIEDVTIDSVRMSGAKGINCVDVRKVSLSALDITVGTPPLVSITDGREFTLDALTVPDGSGCVLQINGPRTDAITILRTSVPDSRMSIGAEVPHQALKFGK